MKSALRRKTHSVERHTEVLVFPWRDSNIPTYHVNIWVFGPSHDGLSRMLRLRNLFSSAACSVEDREAAKTTIVENICDFMKAALESMEPWISPELIHDARNVLEQQTRTVFDSVMSSPELRISLKKLWLSDDIREMCRLHAEEIGKPSIL
jgi:hypothetical protein